MSSSMQQTMPSSDVLFLPFLPWPGTLGVTLLRQSSDRGAVAVFVDVAAGLASKRLRNSGNAASFKHLREEGVNER